MRLLSRCYFFDKLNSSLYGGCFQFSKKILQTTEIVLTGADYCDSMNINYRDSLDKEACLWTRSCLIPSVR